MLDTIFKLVLSTSVYAGIVGAVILVLKLFLKNRINPKWHYFIWIVLLVKLLVPFGPESALSLFNTIPAIPQQTDFSQLYEEYHKTCNTISQSGDKSQITAAWAVKDSSLYMAAVAEDFLPYIWLAGFIMMLCWLGYTNYVLNRRIKRSSTSAPEHINRIFDECRIKLGIKKDIGIIVQNIIGSPSLFGVLNPRILISGDISSLSGKEISYIFLHELAHYKRKDLIANYVLLLLQAIHWFNPVLWYCFKRIRHDMEVAADELVLELLESGEQKEYGRALLSVLENFSFPRLTPRMIGMVDDKKNIEKRIRMIKKMDFFKKRRRVVFIIGVLCILTLSGVLLTSGLTRGNAMGDQQINPAKKSDNTSSTNTSKAELNNPILNLSVAPEKYSLTMSSTPGIRIMPQYSGEADKVGYSAEHGRFLTWASPGGKITEYGKSIELPLDTPVYWSPLESDSAVDVSAVAVKAIVFNKDKKLAVNQVNIIYDGSYTVLPSEGVTISPPFKPQPQNPTSIEEAVSEAIKDQSKNYAAGEVFTEGHIILDTEEKDEKRIVYTISSYGAFGFENGIFTKVSGSGAIPTVMTFSKNGNGEYVLQDYKEPMDGSYYIKSIKEIFPKRLWDKVLTGNNKYPELAKQQEKQAAEYLDSIGRNAEVKAANVEKKLPEINVDASNKIFTEYTKYDSELNNFPYWIGTRELLQNGARYIYETSQNKTGDGYDLIIFRKTKEDGSVVLEYRYKIVDSEPELLNK